MNQTERRYFLIRELLKEQPQYRQMEIPEELVPCGYFPLATAHVILFCNCLAYGV